MAYINPKIAARGTRVPDLADAAACGARAADIRRAPGPDVRAGRVGRFVGRPVGPIVRRVARVAGPIADHRPLPPPASSRSSGPLVWPAQQLHEGHTMRDGLDHSRLVTRQKGPAATLPNGLRYRFQCTIGCDPSLPFFCRPVLDQGVREACRLAISTARKLEATPLHASTVREFRRFFGDDPARPVPAAGNVRAAAIVADRFKKAEEGLRGKGTLYRCERCDAAALAEVGRGSIQDAHAIAFPKKNEVWLCPSFWKLPKFVQAGVLIHEMLHLVFDPLFNHGPMERRGSNAYCYETFALKLAGHVPEQLAIDKCVATPP